MVKATRVFIF